MAPYLWRDKVDHEEKCRRIWFATYGHANGLNSRPVTEPTTPLPARLQHGGPNPERWLAPRIRRHPFEIEDQLGKTVQRMEQQARESTYLSPHVGTYFGPALHGSVPLRWSRLPTPAPSSRTRSIAGSMMSSASLPSIHSVSLSVADVDRRAILEQRQLQLEQQLMQVRNTHLIPSHPIPSHPIPSHPIPSHTIPPHAIRPRHDSLYLTLYPPGLPHHTHHTKPHHPLPPRPSLHICHPHCFLQSPPHKCPVHRCLSRWNRCYRLRAHRPRRPCNGRICNALRAHLC